MGLKVTYEQSDWSGMLPKPFDKDERRITVDTYDKKATELEQENEMLNKKLLDLTCGHKEFDMDRSYLLKLASRSEEIFNSSKPSQKNKILRIATFEPRNQTKKTPI